MGEYAKTFRVARQMNINPRAAANMRIRFLTEEIHFMAQPKKIHPVVALWIKRNMDEILWLHEEVRKKETPEARFVRVDRITDEDIDTAKDYPVKDLVEFHRGKATAWCHEDKRPSLYFADRINKIVCPVCNKTFNAIDILMTRDGMSFKDAVKELRR